jgi:hypothetical protein
MAPPGSDKMTALVMNWERMSQPRAPTAMRSPITQVHPVPLTSMTFMMPMPPMTRLMTATP